LLERFGLVDAGPSDPDLCVLNTCAVTAAAASKSRQALRALARRFPAARLVVVGCYVSIAGRSLREIPRLVMLADHRRGFLPALREFLTAQSSSANRQTIINGSSSSLNTCSNLIMRTENSPRVKSNFATYPVTRFDGRHRAVLKIQDGCDANCTYCIIPLLRPDLDWAPKDEVLAQARRFLDAGHKEIILSGVFLGAYGKTTARPARFDQPGQPLIELVESILALPALGRLRLSSLEPGDLTIPLLKTVTSSEKFAPHLHLPLQSGSDRILKRMGRQYSVKEYFRAVELAHTYLPDLAVTTDVIAGFPGETDEDFRATVELARKIGFAKIHIFPFSARKQTAAYRWRSEIPPQHIVKTRLREMHELETALGRAFCRSFSSKTVRVLVEKIDAPGKISWCLGRADQYFQVRFAGDRSLDNSLVRVRIDDLQPDGSAVLGTFQSEIVS